MCLHRGSEGVDNFLDSPPPEFTHSTFKDSESEFTFDTHSFRSLSIFLDFFGFKVFSIFFGFLYFVDFFGFLIF